MRISKGISNQISKVNVTFCLEKIGLYMYDENFASKNMKIT